MTQKRDTFQVEAVNDCIVLSGPLTGSKAVKHKIVSALKGVASGGARKIVIVAHRALLNPDGVVAWADTVETYLAEFQLYYSTSQLGTILQFDEAYTHKYSEYEFPLCNTQQCKPTSASRRSHSVAHGSHAFA